MITALITGGLSSGVERLWDFVRNEQPPPPLTAAAEVERDRRTSFVFTRPLGALQAVPPNFGPSSPDVRVQWAERNDGMDAYTTKVQVVIEGQNEAPVVLRGLSVKVLERRRPPTGALVLADGAGAIAVRHFAVDLDEPVPTPEFGTGDEPRPGQNRIDFPYRVSTIEPEVFNLYANTDRCDCSWEARLEWVFRGQRGETLIRDGNRPFRTASGHLATETYTSGEGRLVPSSP